MRSAKYRAVKRVAVSAMLATLCAGSARAGIIYGTEIDDYLTTDTYMDYTLDIGGGKEIRVVSSVEYNSALDMNVFDWTVHNDSGDTLLNLKFTGQDYALGRGVNHAWKTAIQDSDPPNPATDFIDFYDDLIGNGNPEEFLAGSEHTNTWGVGSFKFESTQGNTFYLHGLKPTAVFTTNATPYAWMDDYGLATDETDPDLDGYFTWQEYVCDTDPTNALSRLDVYMTTNGVEFTSSSNRLYGVNGCTNLVSNHWNPVTNNLPGTGSMMTLPVDWLDDAGFFRVDVRAP